MNEFDEAFTELHEAKTEAMGKDEFVLLEGKKKAAIVSEIRCGDIIVGGGIAQADGFECQISKRILPDKPRQGDEIECRGEKRTVINANEINDSTWYVFAGDPASET